MKRYTNIEIAFALMGLAFVILGVLVMIFPDGVSFYSPASSESDYLINPKTSDVEINTRGSYVYIYGTIAIIVGCGMALMALFPWRAKKGKLLDE